MFYKVIKEDKVIDVLNELIYLKYQEKHDRMLFCDENEAQAIFSSDRKTIWHEETLYNLPVSGYDTVKIEEIDEYDYKRLKALNCGTIEDVIDEAVTSIIVNGDVAMLIESLKRLYKRQEIDVNKVVEVCNAYKIAEKDKDYILK